MRSIIDIIVQARDNTKAGISAATKKVGGLSGAVGKLGSAIKSGLGAVAKLAKRVAVGVIAIGAAVVVAMKKAEEFNLQLAQITTLSSYTVREAGKDIRKLSAEFGLAKEELTKGLYDALSAGVPKENAFEFLRTAAKTARAGASSTAEAVDLLTTSMNAWQLSYYDTERVSDILFTTVRLGKTTISELAQSMSTVAPIASTMGVPLEQVAAAIATMTKQGAKTSEAMVRLRSALKAMSSELGDGWSSTMTLQQGMEAMTKKAGGSTQALLRMTGRMEGAMGIMALTGRNANMAAEDIRQFTDSTGAMADAFSRVENINPLQKMVQALHNIVTTAGDVALTTLGTTIDRATKAAARFAETIANWTAGPKIAALKQDIEDLTGAMAAGTGAQRMEVVKSIGNVILAALRDGADYMADVFSRLKWGFDTKEFWKNFNVGKDAIGAMFTGSQDDFQQAAFSGFYDVKKASHLEKALAELRETTKGVVAENKKLGVSQEEIDAADPAKIMQRNRAMAESRNIAREAQEEERRLAAQRAREEGVEAAGKAIDEEMKLIVEADKKKTQLEKDRARLLGTLEDDKTRKRRDELNKQIADTQRFAKMTVDTFIKAAKDEKQQDAKLQDDKDAARKIAGKERRGIRLSRRDQEFIDAFRAIQKGQAAGAVAQKELLKIDDAAQVQKLDDIKVLLEQNGKDMNALLRWR